MEVAPIFAADDDVIVQWRAVTVGFLDDLVKEVNHQLSLREDDILSLAQLLDAGTWNVDRGLCLTLSMSNCQSIHPFRAIAKLRRSRDLTPRGHRS